MGSFGIQLDCEQPARSCPCEKMNAVWVSYLARFSRKEAVLEYCLVRFEAGFLALRSLTSALLSTMATLYGSSSDLDYQPVSHLISLKLCSVYLILGFASY